jgi:uncharacterized protein YdiU (UPF0061 family)
MHFCTTIILTLMFKQTYVSLSPKLYHFIEMPRLEADRLCIFNQSLSEEMGLTGDGRQVVKALQEGYENRQFRPFAQAYSGHQFGHYTLLGDGRAMILGEYEDQHGQLLDIQLKGSGKTPYSRGGDGKATVYSMLREYLMSELLHAMGVPTNRSLGVLETGEEVYRDRIHKGAILMRVAQSHLRVGTFEYAVRMLNPDEYRAFFMYAVNRHYPWLLSAEEVALDFLKEVMRKHMELVVHWMRIGFIHGVMNTDNMTISGQTIDYGPCAFLNAYNPSQVFSSIDQNGRYAFGNQAAIAQWNIACLAGTLISLVHKDKATATDKVKEVIHSFPEAYHAAFLAMMGKKLGLSELEKGDEKRIEALLQMMATHRWDYNGTFLSLDESLPWMAGQAPGADFAAWKEDWEARIQRSKEGKEGCLRLMRQTNPLMIPRNHMVEAALEQAVATDNVSGIEQMIADFNGVYESKSLIEKYGYYPENHDTYYQTYCGT